MYLEILTPSVKYKAGFDLVESSKKSQKNMFSHFIKEYPDLIVPIV